MANHKRMINPEKLTDATRGDLHIKLGEIYGALGALKQIAADCESCFRNNSEAGALDEIDNIDAIGASLNDINETYGDC